MHCKRAFQLQIASSFKRPPASLPTNQREMSVAGMALLLLNRMCGRKHLNEYKNMKINPLITIILAASVTAFGQSVQSGTGTAAGTANSRAGNDVAGSTNGSGASQNSAQNAPGVPDPSQAPRSTPGDVPPGQSGEPVEPGLGTPPQTNNWQTPNIPAQTNNWQYQNATGQNDTNSNGLNETNNGYANNTYGNTNWLRSNTNSIVSFFGCLFSAANRSLLVFALFCRI